jgi:hypothetical protein
MKRVALLITCLLFVACTLKSYKYGITPIPKGFSYVKYTGSFKMRVSQFYPNQALCGRVVTYALAIGEPTDQSLPKKLSVLLMCENKVYKAGDTLIITTLNDSLAKRTSPSNTMYIIHYKKIKSIDHQRIIGSEYPAVWGIVTNN